MAEEVTYYEDQELTEEEIIAIMEQRGEESLLEHQKFVSVDGTVLINGTKYVYGRDFNLGDYVTVYSNALNKYFNLQIISVTKSTSEGVDYLDIGFGVDRLTMGTLIKREA